MPLLTAKMNSKPGRPRTKPVPVYLSGLARQETEIFLRARLAEHQMSFAMLDVATVVAAGPWIAGSKRRSEYAMAVITDLLGSLDEPIAYCDPLTGELLTE